MKQHYIKRTRVVVDADEREPSRSRSVAEYVFPLANPIENVLSIELVGWAVDNLQAPTWLGRYDTLLPGEGSDSTPARSAADAACTYDFRIEDGADAVEFTVDMEYPQSGPGSWCSSVVATPTALAALMNSEANASFTALGVAYGPINHTNTTLAIGLDAADRLTVVAYRTAGPNAPLVVRLLFGSGPTASSSGPVAAGFVPGQDTAVPALTSTLGVGSGTNYLLTGDYRCNPQPHRYLDVYIGQAPEQTPHARLFFDHVAEEGLYQRPIDPGHRSRALVYPVRLLRELSVRLELPGGARPLSRGRRGHTLVFDVLSRAQTPEGAPSWLSQVRAL
jgi:hypothetical protein